MTIREIVVLLLVVGGLFFALVGVIGLFRLPDVYARAHSVSKSETLGAVMALGGVAIALETQLAAFKVILILLFMFLTNPTAAHAITRAAADQGVEPYTTEEDQ